MSPAMERQSEMTIETDLLTVAEVRQILGVSRNVAYEAIRSGQIPHFRVGQKLIRVSRKALEEAIANGLGKAGGNN